MKNDNDEILGYIKYEGQLVSDGYLDARKSADTLLGIDEVIRYFIYQENPQIQGFEFEIPVRIRKGSWETIFPENPEKWAAGAFALWMAGKYTGSALEEIAKNDFKDVSLKEIFKKAFKGAINVIKLAKHLGTISKKKFENVEFGKNNELIKITNENGEELWIPPEMLELYSNCPQSIFNKMTKIIEEERELVVGMKDENIIIEEKITLRHKYIFTKPDEEEEIILPELKHGEYIEIQGHVTRGNEKSNTIGFLYSGHIITCFPETGNVKEYKNNLFNNCLLKGYVDRVDKSGKLLEKRPRIKFIDIINLDRSSKNLFD
ncbi:MAG: hypothetical protein K0S33_3100 [Bacteroidetes bacterium]|jgi:hypothetical protein|nr:hypothetical protein [Bacteroidota bacterium]